MGGNSVNISFPDSTYKTLLKEANRRDMSMAKLCSELLTTAANIIEKQQTDHQRGIDEQHKKLCVLTTTK